jgi:hypothetical protein
MTLTGQPYAVCAVVLLVTGAVLDGVPVAKLGVPAPLCRYAGGLGLSSAKHIARWAGVGTASSRHTSPRAHARCPVDQAGVFDLVGHVEAGVVLPAGVLRVTAVMRLGRAWSYQY